MTDIKEIDAPAIPELSRFLQKFPGLEGSAEFWESRFRLWWSQNPAFASGAPRGWLLRDGGAIAGCLVNVPSFVQIEGRPVAAFSTSTWMVLPQCRDRSLELLFKEMDAAKGSALFNGTPTEPVAEVLENLGFQSLPWGPSKESLIALDAGACAKAYCGLPFVSVPGGLALAAWQKLRLSWPHDPAYEVSVEAKTGPEFDDLWEATRGLFANTNVRSAAAIAWHCSDDPFVPKRLLACRKEGRLEAFMILKERRRRGLRTLDCADFWSREPFKAALGALVGAAARLGRDEGLALASFPHFNAGLGSCLKGFGLFELPVARRAYVWTGGPALDPSRSYFVSLQGDAGTSPA